VIEEMKIWSVRPLESIYAAVFIDGGVHRRRRDQGS
jgi:transposase-like protein